MRPCRSVLFLPASNARAIEKARTLPVDVVILDLEDAVGPDDKVEARDRAVEAVAGGGFGNHQVGVRINGLDTAWGAADLESISAHAGLVLIPKAGAPEDIAAIARRAAPGTEIWAMIETPGAVVDLPSIAAAPGLTGLVLGANDLALGLRARRVPGRAPLTYAMGAVVAAARANGLAAIDSVFNDLEDAQGFAAECAQGRDFGFDGKSLIHPSQIDACNRAFSPSEAERTAAQAIVEAFARPENAGRGAIRVNGGMAERLHLAQAVHLLSLPGATGHD